MMTSRSLICLLENQNGGKLQKHIFLIFLNESTGGIVIGLIYNWNFALYVLWRAKKVKHQSHYHDVWRELTINVKIQIIQKLILFF
jgi:hypothetical protein